MAQGMSEAASSKFTELEDSLASEVAPSATPWGMDELESHTLQGLNGEGAGAVTLTTLDHEAGPRAWLPCASVRRTGTGARPR